MVLLEIYSKNFKCGAIARFQMKYDVQEILRKLENLLHTHHYTILSNKYLNFIEVYFYR